MRNIILDRIAYVRDQIDSQEDVHTLVHEIRKTIKRIRAVLKLIRDEIGYGDYYRENRFYSDLGRSLSGARDSYVLSQVFASLHEQDLRAIRKKDYEAVMEQLATRIDRELAEFTRSKGGFDPIRAALGQASERVDQYCRLRHDFGAIRKGIRRIYKRGREHLSKVREQYDVAVFHEYRKNTKYFLHQVEIIRPIYPRVLKSYAKSIDRHAELLGEIRDCDRMETYLRTEAGKVVGDRVISAVQKKTEARKKELLEDAFSKSTLIYAESPGELVRRLESYWDAVQDIHTY